MKAVGKVQFERLGREVAAYCARLERDGQPRTECVVAHAFLEGVKAGLGDRITSAGMALRSERRKAAEAFLNELIASVDGIPF